MKNKYKGFNKDLTKEDLSKEELLCYDKLMEGINNASQEEKDEIAHLMEVFIEVDETVPIKCFRCGEEFKENSSDDKKIYCDDCLSKMWSPINV